MNQDNLLELINRYEAKYDYINDSEHDEIFKWHAIKHFRDVWFSDEVKSMTFAKRFHEAMKESSIMINNSMISPTNGVVKLAEKYPEQVEQLFNVTLFSGETNPDIVQGQMDHFLDEMENLRQKEFPQYYRYKQERHAASCYLAFYNPTVHFVYRYSDAEEFAKHVEFGKDLGAGNYFSLANYYEMAQLVVDELKKHPSLLDKHSKLISKDPHHYYEDTSLHLMAFDLMYCSRCYNFYSGMPHISKKESIKGYEAQRIKDEEQRAKEALQQKLEDAMHDIDLQLEKYESISLLDVEVSQKNYGSGTIIKQDRNKVVVQFADVQKSFVIGKQFKMRPIFENDTEIVDAFTEYAELLKKRATLEKQLKRL